MSLETNFRSVNLSVDRSTPDQREEVEISTSYLVVTSLPSAATLYRGRSDAEGIELVEGQQICNADGSAIGRVFIGNAAGSGELELFFSNRTRIDSPSSGADGGGSGPSQVTVILQPSIRDINSTVTGTNVLTGANVGNGVPGNTSDDDGFATVVGTGTGSGVVYTTGEADGPRLSVKQGATGTPNNQNTIFRWGSNGWIPGDLIRFIRQGSDAYGPGNGVAWYEEFADEIQADIGGASDFASFVFVGFTQLLNINTGTDGLRAGFYAAEGDTDWRFIIQDDANTAFQVDVELTGYALADINLMGFRWGQDADGTSYLRVYGNGELIEEITAPGVTCAIDYLEYVAHRDSNADALEVRGWHTLRPKIQRKEFG